MTSTTKGATRSPKLVLRALALTWSLLVSVNAFAEATPTKPVKITTFKGKVIGVSDGDTIKVMHNGAPDTVRLKFIDCPEKKQDFGQVAKEFTAKQCFGKVVQVRSTGRDRYNRCVGEVVLPNYRILNLELVRSGNAWWYEQFAKDALQYKLAQEKARAGHKGLWGQIKPQPPWEFRKAKTAPLTVAQTSLATH
jgi:endonuclease YncB( thermonuclease family)